MKYAISAAPVSLPSNIAKRGVSEKYPFAALPAPIQATEPDPSGATNKDGTPKMIKAFEADGKTPKMLYFSFPVDRPAKKMNSTCFSAMERFAEIEKNADGTDKKDEKGKPVKIRHREFKAMDCDPTTDPDGALCRIYRLK